MKIGIIGVNYKSADLKLREKLARACQRRFGPGQSAHTLSYILLSTCNRTEIYFCSEDLAETHTYLLNVLRNDMEEEFEHRVYSYFGYDCFFHLACVTAGMDSAIIGETEIQGQVKQAYEKAGAYHRLSKELHFLFQKCLKIGKEIRTSMALSRGVPTLENAIINSAISILGNLENAEILFVGLSEINKKIASQFKKSGFQNLTFCNRSLGKLQEFAIKENVRQLSWEKLEQWKNYDLIVFGTSCPHFLVERVESEIRKKKLLIDLSVPRNVDPRIGRQTFMTLLNIDQLNRTIDKKRHIKAAEIVRIENQFIAHSVARQIHLFHLKNLQLYMTQVS